MLSLPGGLQEETFPLKNINFNHNRFQAFDNIHLYVCVFTAFLEAMLAYCCRTMSTLVYNSSETADLDLHLPIVVNLEADCNSNKQSNLVPMVPDTGIAFVLVKNGKSNPSLQMMKSLFSTWPVLVFTLILSLIAGIIVWSLVG